MKKVLVIGGGPSGLMAAIAAARAGAQTTVLEAGAKPGRKLLLTGNGRCNLTNLNEHIASVYDSSDPEFARGMVRSVLSQFSVQDTLDFFRQEGLLTSVEHRTYVYPVTGQSASVLEILLRTLKALKVKMKYSEEASVMKLVPLFDRVVLKQILAEETTKSGIVLPGQAKEKPQQAEVIAVGPGGVVDGKEIKMQVKVGDKVIYSKYSGTDVELDDEKYVIVKQNDILAVIE